MPKINKPNSLLKGTNIDSQPINNNCNSLLSNKSSNSSTKINIKTLNVQGLTNIKYAELSKLINKDDILCLTETQLKYSKISIDNNLNFLESMRKIDDRRGGGLLIIYNPGTYEIKEMQSNHPDLLVVSCKKLGFKFKIILPYISVNDNDRNRHIYAEISKHLEEIDIPTILTGDLNGHVGFIGQQKLDKNGQMILQTMEEHNLTMLNAHPNCHGETTWQRRESRSVI